MKRGNVCRNQHQAGNRGNANTLKWSRLDSMCFVFCLYLLWAKSFSPTIIAVWWIWINMMSAIDLCWRVMRLVGNELEKIWIYFYLKCKFPLGMFNGIINIIRRKGNIYKPFQCYTSQYMFQWLLKSLHKLYNNSIRFQLFFSSILGYKLFNVRFFILFILYQS